VDVGGDRRRAPRDLGDARLLSDSRRSSAGRTCSSRCCPRSTRCGVLGARRAGESRRGCSGRRCRSAIFVACLVAAFLPQMLAWRAIYGTMIARSRSARRSAGRIPHVVDILWSARNGLFSTRRSSISARSVSAVRARAAAVGMPALAAVAVDGVLQRLHPGLVGIRRVRRTQFDGLIPSSRWVSRRSSIAAACPAASRRRAMVGALALLAL
jgi:hypothetical protein